MPDDKLTELEKALALALAPPPPAEEPPPPISTESTQPRWRVVQEASEDMTLVLVPAAAVARRIPLWGWGAMAGALAVLFLVIVYVPAWATNRTTRLLADENPDVVHEAMRQLAADSSNRAVRALSSLAASPSAPERARLHAVDTLSLSRNPTADQALLDLSTAADVAGPVRQAAALARRQRAGAAPEQ